MALYEMGHEGMKVWRNERNMFNLKNRIQNNRLNLIRRVEGIAPEPIQGLLTVYVYT
jgi:hypothetical protein